jgi:hypothetical protein
MTIDDPVYGSIPEAARLANCCRSSIYHMIATSPNPEMKNTYNPNMSEEQKAKDEQNQGQNTAGASTAGSQPAAPSTESKTVENQKNQK